MIKYAYGGYVAAKNPASGSVKIYPFVTIAETEAEALLQARNLARERFSKGDCINMYYDVVELTEVPIKYHEN